MFAKALNQTLTEYKISGKELSIRSGVKEATISEFRNGKIEPKLGTIEALINALPQQAKNYMLFKAFLTDLTDDDISLLLYAIATELRGASNRKQVGDQDAVRYDLVLR